MVSAEICIYWAILQFKPNVSQCWWQQQKSIQILCITILREVEEGEEVDFLVFALCFRCVYSIEMKMLDLEVVQIYVISPAKTFHLIWQGHIQPHCATREDQPDQLYQIYIARFNERAWPHYPKKKIIEPTSKTIYIMLFHCFCGLFGINFHDPYSMHRKCSHFIAL